MKKRLALLLFTLAGVCNGLWMLILHLQYEKLGSVCSVNKTISCEVLTFKQYSEFWGVPLPIYALFTFLLLFILAFRGWRNIGPNQKQEDAFAMVLSTLSLLTAIGMAYISFVILKKLCVFCFLFYIIIVATWLLNRALLRANGASACTSVKNECYSFYKNQWVLFTGIAFACVIVFSHFAFVQKGTLSENVIAIKGDDMKTTGNPNAKVTLTIFSDFQCPACKNGAGILKELEDAGYTAKMKIVYKFFPLDPSCNKGTPGGQHLMACDAAKAAVCAGQQQKFWRFHDRLFEAQPSFYEKKFYQIAEEENLDMNKFAACWHSKSALEEVIKDAEEGTAIPITATPTFFFNGKKFEGVPTADAIKTMVDKLQ